MTRSRGRARARWSCLALALIAGWAWMPAADATAERRSTASGAREDSAGRVAIHPGRTLFLECRGEGHPTVVLEAGTGDLGAIWSRAPTGSGPAVLPAVARFTRVVPFKAHGAAEAAIGVALPAMPYLLGFADNKAARNVCFGLAALTFIVASLTDWNSPEADHRHKVLPA